MIDGLFENMVFAEHMKRSYAQGQQPDLWFWQETATNEVDLVIEHPPSRASRRIRTSTPPASWS